MNKFFIIIGITLVIIGILWSVIGRMGLGHLPGDIIIKREHFTLYIPITTSIIISIIFSILWYFSKYF